jgi:hypothetical protein
MQVTLSLTITVTYDLNGESEQSLRENLEFVAAHAAGSGLLTGEGPAEVDEWS